MSVFRTRIKYWRDLRAYSQNELSARSGVSRITIANAEKTGDLPIPEVRKRLADALGITTEELITENPKYADGPASTAKAVA